MKPTAALCVACVMLPCCAAAQPHDNRHYEGTAYAADGHVAYKEEHFVFDDTNSVPSRLVIYRCPSGEPFARKWVHDRESDEAPDFDLQDARSGYREGVRTTGGRREAFVQEKGEPTERIAALPKRADPVIDAGFDAFVRNHWDELGKPGKGRMDFVVPSRLGYMDMRLKEADAGSVDGDPVRHMRLVVDTWYGLAAPTIDLSYGSSDHLLRRFKGLSNVLDAAGKRQDVRIEFPASAVRAPPSREEIERAAAVTLTTHCTP